LSTGTPLTILRTTPVKPRKIHEKMWALGFKSRWILLWPQRFKVYALLENTIKYSESTV
jgi:hypothetical protein